VKLSVSFQVDDASLTRIRSISIILHRKTNLAGCESITRNELMFLHFRTKAHGDVRSNWDGKCRSAPVGKKMRVEVSRRPKNRKSMARLQKKLPSGIVCYLPAHASRIWQGRNRGRKRTHIHTTKKFNEYDIEMMKHTHRLDSATWLRKHRKFTHAFRSDTIS
jgi:hypothetical protein